MRNKAVTQAVEPSICSYQRKHVFWRRVVTHPTLDHAKGILNEEKEGRRGN
jgi:hypothetical protein